jgi:hypothetical protein
MQSNPRWLAPLRLGVLALMLSGAAPASAQWSRVTEVPVTQVFSVWSRGDTIAAGADTAVYLSTDAGVSWKTSTKPVAGVGAIDAVRMRNGRLYAGTFGQGVFVSDDRGTTWNAFNQGLTGGVLNSQLSVSALAVRGDSLVAATEGAGVWVRNLAATSVWQPFGSVFSPNQADNVSSADLGGTRLIASAGGNGMVFFRDPGDADWTVSNLDNIGIHAGVLAREAVWTGTGWVVGTNAGLFHSVAGQEPWTRVDPGLGSIDNMTFATAGHHLFVAIDLPAAAVIEESDDDGASWPIGEFQSGVFVLKMAVGGGSVYAARGDGLWRRPVGIASVPEAGRPSALRFAVSGPQPFRDHVGLRFELSSPSHVTIEVFDVQGRKTAVGLAGDWPSGAHEVRLDTRELRPGIYAARLSANGAHPSVPLVLVR